MLPEIVKYLYLKAIFFGIFETIDSAFYFFKIRMFGCRPIYYFYKQNTDLRFHKGLFGAYWSGVERKSAFGQFLLFNLDPGPHFSL